MTGRVERIRGAVARYFGVQPARLSQVDRHATVSRARHVAIYLVREQVGFSYPECAREFGCVDHTSAIYAHRKIKASRDVDLDVWAALVAIESTLAKEAA